MTIRVKDNFRVHGKEWRIPFCSCADIDLLSAFFSIRGTAVPLPVSVTSVHNTYLNDTCTHTYRLEMSKDNCPFVTKVSIFVKDIIMLYP